MSPETFYRLLADLPFACAGCGAAVDLLKRECQRTLTGSGTKDAKCRECGATIPALEWRDYGMKADRFSLRGLP